MHPFSGDSATADKNKVLVLNHYRWHIISDARNILALLIPAPFGYSVSQVNSALHPSGVAKSSTSFGWGKGGKVTSAGWQVTLCDLIWHVVSRSGVVISITNCYIRFTYLLYLLSVELLAKRRVSNRADFSNGTKHAITT